MRRGEASQSRVTLSRRVSLLRRTMCAGFYAPMTPRRGLHFSADTEVTPALEGTDWDPPAQPIGIDWTSDQHLTSGWVTARDEIVILIHAAFCSVGSEVSQLCSGGKRRSRTQGDLSAYRSGTGVDDNGTLKWSRAR